ncbi:hypothetical protein MNBD_ALPHA11-529 [hydrothermal vent metagenome]|uniref:Inner membrane protein YgaP-like transmembrane domain-containing protein n=1 Tax=hydrothermal vent metagenome TaxID=652676 RepID=A0A3B0U690_9ZZZZ
MLKKNVGSLERIIRLVVGVAALAAFFMLPDASYRYWLLIGIVPLATGLLSSCPLYTIFGISTCKMKSE